MANTIRLKRGTTTPVAGNLVTGEVAINTADGTAFTKTDGGSVVQIGGGGGGGGLTISSLSNGATSTLNATVPTEDTFLGYNGTDLVWTGTPDNTPSHLTVQTSFLYPTTAPTTGQALTFDGTDLAWATVSGGGGGLSDAPSDGKAYVRKDAGWVKTVINEWDYTATYAVGDQVYWTGGSSIYNIYLCTSAPPTNESPSDASYWTGLAGATGAMGAMGTNGTNGTNGPTSAGTWDGSTYYYQGQYVIYYGLVYLCVANPAYYGLSPDTNPSDWVIMAVVGTNGMNGTNGTNGANGASGAMNYLDILTINSGASGYISSGVITMNTIYQFSQWAQNKFDSYALLRTYVNGSLADTQTYSHSYTYSVTTGVLTYTDSFSGKTNYGNWSGANYYYIDQVVLYQGVWWNCFANTAYDDLPPDQLTTSWELLSVNTINVFFANPATNEEATIPYLTFFV